MILKKKLMKTVAPPSDRVLRTPPYPVWPAVSWSSVDHAGRWKLAHYAARRANAPQMAIWHRERSDSLEMVVFNDNPDSLRGHLRTAVCDFYGDTIDSRSVNISLAGRTSKKTTIAPMIEWKKSTRDTYLTWSLYDATGAKTCQQSALWESPDQTRLPLTNVTLVRTQTAVSYTHLRAHETLR